MAGQTHGRTTFLFRQRIVEHKFHDIFYDKMSEFCNYNKNKCNNNENKLVLYNIVVLTRVNYETKSRLNIHKY